MKNLTFLLIICTISLGIISCGGSEEALMLKFEGEERNLVPKTGWFARNDREDTSLNYFKIMNFKMEEGASYQTNYKLNSPEEFYITFILNGSKGKDKNLPLRTGEYPIRQVTEEGMEKHDVAQSATIYYLKDGEPDNSHFGENNSKGKVVLESVTEDKITGTIDFRTDYNDEIKGGFTVNKVKMK